MTGVSISKDGDFLLWVNFVVFLEVAKKGVMEVYTTVTLDFNVYTEESDNVANKFFHFKPRSLKATRMKAINAKTKVELPEETEVIQG